MTSLIQEGQVMSELYYKFGICQFTVHLYLVLNNQIQRLTAHAKATIRKIQVARGNEVTIHSETILIIFS
jgi:hypothetical protein